MTLLKLCLCLCLFVSPMYATWDALIVKWGLLGKVSSVVGNAFYSIPTTASDASSQGWTQVDSDSDYWNIWCYPKDPRECILTDLQGNFAGMDIGVLPSDIASEVYDTSEHKIYENITRMNITITKTRFFLVSQDVLESGGRSNMTEGLGTGLWLKVGDTLVEIPTTADEIERETDFTTQNCIPTMGDHYFYNMTSEMDCRQNQPYFLLTDHSTGILHGVGLQLVGKETVIGRKLYEDTPKVAVELTVPNRPTCLTDWVSTYGAITLHIYFRSSPWSIGCGGILGTGLG